MSPIAVTDRDGVILDTKEVLDELKWEVKLVSDLAYYEMTTKNLERLQDFLENVSSTYRNKDIGRKLEFAIPEEYLPDSRTGRSRLHYMFGAKVVGELKSWLERTKAAKGESTKYVSQGWARTVNSNSPHDLLPKINLADADAKYSRTILDGDYLILEMVIRGRWYRLLFHHEGRLSRADRATLPSISLNKKGNIRFAFSAAYKYNYTPFSTEYVIGVDVGIKNYATVSVINHKTKEIVYSTTLSRRVHSLTNKVRNANQQVKSLQCKNRSLEAALHREANSRRKKALAILAAQEIAEIAHNHNNAVVVVEDLSWIRNTMQNGRWNRGELIKRIKEQVELNGGRVFKTSAYNTSKNCHKCGGKVAFKNWHTAICKNCNSSIDRDLNATVNIAMRFVDKGSYAKALRTRNTSKNKKNKPVKRTINNPGRPLKYPGRDRTKNRPTPKRKRKGGETRTYNLCSARNNEDSIVALDQPTVSEREPVTVIGSTINRGDCPLILYTITYSSAHIPTPKNTI